MRIVNLDAKMLLFLVAVFLNSNIFKKGASTDTCLISRKETSDM